MIVADHVAAAPLVIVAQIDGSQSYTYAGQPFVADVTDERREQLLAAGFIAKASEGVRPAARRRTEGD